MGVGGGTTRTLKCIYIRITNYTIKYATVILTYPSHGYAVNLHVLALMDSVKTSCERVWLHDNAVDTAEKQHTLFMFQIDSKLTH